VKIANFSTVNSRFAKTIKSGSAQAPTKQGNALKTGDLKKLDRAGPVH
jgi:hypothetical protein